MIGSTLGPYMLRERLGHSAAGDLYLAEDVEKGGIFVVRTFPGRTSEDEERGERALHDARSASGLGDPRVERIIDAGWIEGRGFIASDPPQGPTLADLLRGGIPLPSREVARIGIELAEILARAHAHGVVHRALEPAFIVLAGPDRSVRVSGFGVAALAESAPGIRETSVPETPYLAPEQRRGEHADHRADIYALGALLWEALTGAAPAVPPDTARIPEGTPPVLPHLLLALLSQDPGARPAALSEEARALREWLATPEGPPPASEEPDARVQGPPSFGPLKTMALLGTGALVVAAARLLSRRGRR